jgi:hypothetical protein
VSTRNPTPLHVGATGTLAGRTYRVAGRIVMSMDDAGETYYWNEFFLKSDEGSDATLVYEETETGGEWRLFTMFEPDTAISANDATAERIGDMVEFEGRNLRVTLVDESRVEYIEGEAPEGVERGDVARYFNAEGANRMFVVSWTGDEVECYRGADLQPRVVADAFGLSHPDLVRLAGPPRGAVFARQQSQNSKAGMVFVVMAIFLIAMVLVVIVTKANPGNRRSVVVRTRAPAGPLAPEAAAMLEGKRFRVTGHRIMEIAQVGRIHESHEYLLKDDDGTAARLICGWSATDPDWWLFTPLNPREPVTPQRAAQLQVGQKLSLDGYEATVRDIFQARVYAATGATLANSGAMQFGFTAHTSSIVLLVLWNDSGIEFYRGARLDAKATKANFQLSAPLEATK